MHLCSTSGSAVADHAPLFKPICHRISVNTLNSAEQNLVVKRFAIVDHGNDILVLLGCALADEKATVNGVLKQDCFRNLQANEGMMNVAMAHTTRSMVP